MPEGFLPVVAGPRAARSVVTRVAPSDVYARYVAATASTSMSIPATARAETSTAVEAGAGPSGR